MGERVELQALIARYNHEDEEDFVAALQTSSGDLTLLRADAKRLIQRDDMRGKHLAAELDVRAIVKLLNTRH